MDYPASKGSATGVQSQNFTIPLISQLSIQTWVVGQFQDLRFILHLFMGWMAPFAASGR
jgi:hypothetical protein